MSKGNPAVIYRPYEGYWAAELGLNCPVFQILGRNPLFGLTSGLVVGWLASA